MITRWSRRVVISLGATVIALVLLLGGVAKADRRVVVTPFTGPGAARIERSVVAIVKRKHTVIPAATYAKAKKKLKVTRATDAAFVKLATELRVDAFVSGTVTRKRRRFELALVVRDGQSGQAIDSLTIPLRAARTDKRADKAIADKLPPIIATAQGREAAPTDDDAETGTTTALDSAGQATQQSAEATAQSTEPPPQPAVEASQAAPVQPPTQPEPEADRKLPDQRVSTAARADAPVQSPHDPRDARLDVGVGISLVARRLAFTYDAALIDVPVGYKGSVIPGTAIAGVFYPSVIGFALELDRFALKSRLEGGAEYYTTQTRYGAGLRLRWNVGSRPTLPTFTLGAGAGQLRFTIDSGVKAVGLPDVTYSFVDPGLAMRFPLGTPAVALVLDARYLHVLGAGEMQDRDQYGGGKTWGVDAGGGFEVRPIPALAVRAGVRLLRFEYTFDGSGMLTTMRDSDSEQDVGGARDQYLGGYITAGWILQ